MLRRTSQVGGAVCAALALGLLLAGCGTGDGPGRPAARRSATPSSTGPTTSPSAGPSASTSASPSTRPSARPSRPGAATPVVTKLVVLVVENHSLAQMRAGMPATAALADRYGYATEYAAVRHPSLPNYLAVLGGSTFGVADDRPPAAHPVRGRSVFGQALAAGRTARLYAEGMPGACATTDGGTRYAVRHNPWTYFVDERAACRAGDVPFEALAGDVAAGRLPTAGMVVPDLCHDAHDCSLASADDWARRALDLLRSGPDWASGHLAVVLTADEDDRRSGNRVLTVVLHPGLHHVVVRTPLTHYSLTRLYDEVLGVPPLREAARAPSMASAFGLRTRSARTR